MKLICLKCGNYRYFEAEVEGLRAVLTTAEGIIVADAIFDDDWNWSDSTLRDNLQDVVDYVRKQSDQALQYDAGSGHYLNRYLSCAGCGSKRVTPPYSDWRPPQNLLSLKDELLKNRKEFRLLRKERHHANILPVLRKP